MEYFTRGCSWGISLEDTVSQDQQGMRGWWGQKGARARVRLVPQPNGTWGMGAQHAICGLKIKLVSKKMRKEKMMH